MRVRGSITAGAFFVLVMLVAQGTFVFAQITDFGDGRKEVTGWTAAPDFSTTIELKVPAECHIRRTSMNVSAVPYDPGHPLGPEGLGLYLNGTLLWEFNGTGYGGLGVQTMFAGGNRTAIYDFPVTGGSFGNELRLPKKAVVKNATFTLNCTGPGKLLKMSQLNGSGGAEMFGNSVAGAGDVNGDGYDDILVGAPYYTDGASYKGRACLYLGGPRLNATPWRTIYGCSTYEYLGYSVASAGDVNADGYADIIIGSPYYTSGTTYYAGRAQLFLGDPNMSTTPAVTLTGTTTQEYLGIGIAGIGDLNGDGYDDVAVGVPGTTSPGKVYVLYGGENMDNVPDMVIRRSSTGEYYGAALSGAGDLNGDGYDDFLVGARTAASYTGMAQVFYGGASPDSGSDLTVYGSSTYDYLGSSVSGGADLNGDGHPDFIVGAPSMTGTGSAYAYFGGPGMDARPDLTFRGEKTYDYFGTSVACAGDINEDGYGDLVVGAPRNSAGATYAGMFYIFHGGPGIDAVADANYSGTATYMALGTAVAGARDVNGDGRSDVVVGAPGISMSIGTVFVYGKVFGLLDPGVTVEGDAPRLAEGYINSTVVIGNLTQGLNNALRRNLPTEVDKYGNGYCDLALSLGASSDGRMTVQAINITYSVDCPVPEFEEALNSYIAAHKTEKDAGGNLTVPLELRSRTAGGATLQDLSITTDEAPRLLRPIPTLHMDEDSYDDQLVDLFDHYQDDFDSLSTLTFSVLSATNASVVDVGLMAGHYLGVNALDGPENDNWTGAVTIVVACADHWGSARASNAFDVEVRNVNDPPMVTSLPPGNITGGIEYRYLITVADGDNDTLSFGLEHGHQDMLLEQTDRHSARLLWTPPAGGKYPVSISISDGKDTVYQNFSLVVPNRAPRIVSVPPATAFYDLPFTYNVSAVDDDGQALTYSYFSNLQGPSMDQATGVLSWTPKQLGEFQISVGVSDGEAKVWQDFTIRVVRANRAPSFVTKPAANATVGVLYVYAARAYDEDQDPLTYRLVSGAPGMVQDGAAGRLSWTPEVPGTYNVSLLASDGRGGEATQEFSISVVEAPRAQVVIAWPEEGASLKGVATFSGSAAKGLRDVMGVQVRIDSGDWRTASGNTSWAFKLDTRNLRHGQHVIEARAFDGLHYSDTVKRAFEVDNPPPPVTADSWLMPGLFIGIPVAAAGAGLLLLASRRKKQRDLQ